MTNNKKFHPTALGCPKDKQMDTLRIAIFFFIVAGMSSFITTQVHAENASPTGDHFDRRHFSRAHLQRKHKHAATPSLAAASGPLVYHVTSYGADPTGNSDSTDAILRAISDALNGPGHGVLYQGIVNLGGARVDLDGGNYLISRPLQFPVPGRGNLVIHGGSLIASGDFPSDGYLIDLSPAANGTSGYNYEFVTLRDLLLDSNYRGGGIQVINSLGQHITGGGDPAERNFSGTAIVLAGNDNSVTEVVIFSSAVGIMITGQANIISGVHCYNKATGFGGTGIYLKTPGLAQTRIVNSYLDYTGIVAEDPVQLTVSNSFFLGDAYVVLKSIKGVVNGVNIVDNMFSGSGNGVEIVQLDQSNGAFNEVDQVVIDKNNVNGMKLKSTVARSSIQGNSSSWTADFNSVFVFPDLIKQVQYTFAANDSSFPAHALRNVSGNKVVIQSDVSVPGQDSVQMYGDIKPLMKSDLSKTENTDTHSKR